MAVLVIIVVATIAMVGFGGQGTWMETSVKFKPKFLDGANMATIKAEINVHILSGNPNKPTITPINDQIDPATIALEGWMSPVPGTGELILTPGGSPKRYDCQFDGPSVKAAVITKLTHMGITKPNPWNPVSVTLTVSGQLYDGTLWQGHYSVKMIFGDILPPN
jgi:hypothetical protein